MLLGSRCCPQTMRFLLHVSAPLQNTFLESNHSPFSFMFAGLTGVRLPVVWSVLGRDIETDSDQSHAAAEAGQLHSNPLLPKLACSAFSCKHGSPVSGSHSPSWACWICLLLVRQALCRTDLPFRCLTNLNFSG